MKTVLIYLISLWLLNSHANHTSSTSQFNSIENLLLPSQKESLDHVQMDECLDDPVVCFVVVRYKDGIPEGISTVRDGVQKQ